MEVPGNFGSEAEEQKYSPNEKEDQKPRNNGLKIVFPSLVFADEGPDNDHDHPNAGNGHDEEREHPKPNRDVVFIALFRHSFCVRGIPWGSGLH
jgi:hypothetical protein